MNATKSNKGIVLALVLSFLALFVMGTVLYLNLTTTDFAAAKRSTYATKAFFMAESGINKALYELRKDYLNYSGESSSINYGFSDKGEYSVSVGAFDGVQRVVTSTGYYLNSTGPHAYASKTLEAGVSSSSTPTWFYDNAVVAGDNVDLIGISGVTGDLKFGGAINPSTTPGATQFSDDFPMLDFVQLKAIAEAQIKPNGQNNLYTAADIASSKPFPNTFWFDLPGLIPNVVYVETDLTLKGNVGTLCGFFVVAGDVITNPSAVSADTTINGNGTIDGCVYTYGDFRINGGATGLGVTGGVWAKNDVRLNGNAQVTFNQAYMDAIDAMNIGVKPQIIYWKEKY